MNHRALTLASAITLASLLGGGGTANAARFAAAQPADHAMSCADLYQGRSFSIETEPHTYLPMTGVTLKTYDDELMRPFQERGEERLQVVHESALHLELNPGSCAIKQTDRAHLLECPLAKDDAVAVKRSSVSFTYEGRSAQGARQSVNVVRDLELESFSMHAEVQQRNGEDRVVATFVVRAKVGNQPRVLQVTKDLGEWTSKKDRSENDRCIVNPS
jgi:hypothetical protein